MQARINGWIIADRELARPVSGEVLSGLALRLNTRLWDSYWEATELEGTLAWVRFDPLNGLLETVIDATDFRVLTEDPAEAEDPLPEVGARVRRVGYLSSVGPYEFHTFGLPDVSQDWRILSVRELTPPDDLVVDLEPVELRLND